MSDIEKYKFKISRKFNKLLLSILFYSELNIINNNNQLLLELDTAKRRISLLNKSDPEIFISSIYKHILQNRKNIFSKNGNMIFKDVDIQITSEKYKSLLKIFKNILENCDDVHQSKIWEMLTILVDISALWIILENNDIENFEKICKKKKIFEKL
jgi:hypothetical protein